MVNRRTSNLLTNREFSPNSRHRLAGLQEGIEPRATMAIVVGRAEGYGRARCRTQWPRHGSRFRGGCPHRVPHRSPPRGAAPVLGHRLGVARRLPLPKQAARPLGAVRRGDPLQRWPAAMDTRTPSGLRTVSFVRCRRGSKNIAVIPVRLWVEAFVPPFVSDCSIPASSPVCSS